MSTKITIKSNLPLYKKALNEALDMLDMCDELEPRSALKQAANDCGIEYGDTMEDFVLWAEERLYM
jgi:hypothetical protein